MPGDHWKPLVTIFWFGENAWEPTFISFMYSSNMLLNLVLN